MILYYDIETYNEVDIAVGTVNYARTAEVTLCAWAVDDGPVQLWDLTRGEPIPILLEAVSRNKDAIFMAHNSYFDRQISNAANLFGVQIPVEKTYCTMAQALSHGLPASLQDLCDIYKLGDDKAKLRDGAALVRWFCKPQGKNKVRYSEKTHPDKWARFRRYAMNDVEAMRALHKAIPKHNHPYDINHIERKIWMRTEEMNLKGFGVDLELASAAIKTAARLKDESDDRVQYTTAGSVGAASEVAALKDYLKDTYGVDLPNMQAATLEREYANMENPIGARELIGERIAASKASVSKYKKLIQCATPQQRMTGTIQYCGAAGSGRDAGRTFQPQNLPRPPAWFEDPVRAEEVIDYIKDDIVDIMEEDPMVCLSAALRGAIVPAKGNKLIASDLSNIEGRMVVWLSGEDWKLDYFRNYDAGNIKFDNYIAAYAKSMGTAPETVTKAQRQVGKCQELSLGYGSGVGGLLQFMEIYRVDVAQLAIATEAVADKALWAETYRKYDWAVKNRFDYNLPKSEWTACDYLKQSWRMAHSKTAQLWADCETAFRQAYVEPGVWHKAGEHLAYRRSGQWIYCRLPSGRLLCYLQPKIDENGITYMSMNQYTRKWCRTKIYSGKFVAHATQASARDLLFHNMLDAEDQGYATVLRVHDEVIAEVPDKNIFTAQGLSNILATPRAWCPDLPLAAEGFETPIRYRK